MNISIASLRLAAEPVRTMQRRGKAVDDSPGRARSPQAARHYRPHRTLGLVLIAGVVLLVLFKGARSSTSSTGSGTLRGNAAYADERATAKVAEMVAAEEVRELADGGPKEVAATFGFDAGDRASSKEEVTLAPTPVLSEGQPAKVDSAPAGAPGADVRPFSAASDETWLLKHHSSRLTSARENAESSSKSLWRVTLDDGAKALFRPVARRESMHYSNAAKELLAFHVDRALGMYRSPAMVGRCFAESVVKKLSPRMLEMSHVIDGQVCGTLHQDIRGVTESCARLQRAFCQGCNDAAARRDLVDLAVLDYLTVQEDRRWEYNVHPWLTSGGGCSACARKKPSVYLKNMHCVSSSGALVLVDNSDAWRNPRWKPALEHALHGLFDGLCDAHASTVTALAKIASQPMNQFTKDVMNRVELAADEFLTKEVMATLLEDRDRGKALATIGMRAQKLSKHFTGCKEDLSQWYGSIYKRKSIKYEKKVYEETFHIPFDEAQLDGKE